MTSLLSSRSSNLGYIRSVGGIRTPCWLTAGLGTTRVLQDTLAEHTRNNTTGLQGRLESMRLDHSTPKGIREGGRMGGERG